MGKGRKQIQIREFDIFSYRYVYMKVFISGMQTSLSPTQTAEYITNIISGFIHLFSVD